MGNTGSSTETASPNLLGRQIVPLGGGGLLKPTEFLPVARQNTLYSSSKSVSLSGKRGDQ